MRSVAQADGLPPFAVRTTAIGVVLLLGAIMVSLLVVAPGDRSGGKAIDMTYYPEPSAKPGYLLDHISIGDRGIAAYTLSAKEATVARRPAVILIHGGAITDVLESSNPQYKGEWLIPHFEETPYALAEAGILVVIIDAWWAGERHNATHTERANADPMAAVVHGYVETTGDVSRVIDYLAERDDVDLERIGVAGKSGGGLISLMAACRDERLEAVVAWKGWADFALMAQLRGQSILLNKALNGNRVFKEELQAWDPIHHVERMPPKAIALIGNREDPLMPRACAENLHKQLVPLYSQNPERLKLTLFETPRPTHDLLPEALRMGCDWLIQHLLAPPS